MELLQSVGSSIGWAFLGVLLLYTAVRLYDFIDPINYRHEIRSGNVAAGMIVAALTVGTAIIVAAVILSGDPARMVR
ncbi:MAG: DUF350 domain-containing protein [Oscillatoriales cyanobacterium SM2_2_1]|nr:DUF350 domain-containing protein [Oscillatoriales cyanobacterium SM2_2_1]